MPIQNAEKHIFTNVQTNESCKTIEQLHSLYMDINEPRVWESPEMQKAIQFAVDDCKTLLDNWVEERSQNVAADLVH